VQASHGSAPWHIANASREKKRETDTVYNGDDANASPPLLPLPCWSLDESSVYIRYIRSQPRVRIREMNQNRIHHARVTRTFHECSDERNGFNQRCIREARQSRAF